jgi:hypothetical protein
LLNYIKSFCDSSIGINVFVMNIFIKTSHIFWVINLHGRSIDFLRSLTYICDSELFSRGGETVLCKRLFNSPSVSQIQQPCALQICSTSRQDSSTLKFLTGVCRASLPPFPTKTQMTYALPTLTYLSPLKQFLVADFAHSTIPLNGHDGTFSGQADANRSSYAWAVKYHCSST